MRAEMPNMRAPEDGSSDVRGLADRGVVQTTSQINDSHSARGTGSGLQVLWFFLDWYKNRKGGITRLSVFATYSSSQLLYHLFITTHLA